MLNQPTETQKVLEVIKAGALSGLTTHEIIELEISEWESDPKRKLMLTGEAYYLNHTDIETEKKREYADGTELKHKSNLKLQYAFVRKLVDQKIGYLLSKLPSWDTENETLKKQLEAIFTRKFWKMLKTAGREAVNKGIAWLHIYYDQDGNFGIKQFPSEQIIPLWLDNDHTELGGIIRFYDVIVYDGKKKTLQRKIEYWTVNGVEYLTVYDGKLIEDVEVVDANGNQVISHTMVNGKPYNWERVPFVPVRYNDIEQPIVDIIKSLVDNYNWQASVNADLIADLPNAFMKLIGYGGADLAEFMRDLKAANAAKLDIGGDIEHEVVEPATAALESMLQHDRKALYEYGRGVDTQAEDMGTASGVALKFRYADLDMDCNIFEAEIQDCFEQLVWFITTHLTNTGGGQFAEETVTLTLNRDIIISETDVITDCKNSVGILPDAQIRANHPWSDEDTERLWEEQEAKQEEDMANAYAGFAQSPQNSPQQQEGTQ